MLGESPECRQAVDEIRLTVGWLTEPAARRERVVRPAGRVESSAVLASRTADRRRGRTMVAGAAGSGSWVSRRRCWWRLRLRFCCSRRQVQSRCACRSITPACAANRDAPKNRGPSPPRSRAAADNLPRTGRPAIARARHKHRPFRRGRQRPRARRVCAPSSGASRQFKQRQSSSNRSISRSAPRAANSLVADRRVEALPIAGRFRRRR